MVIKPKIEKMKEEFISKAGHVKSDLEVNTWSNINLRITDNLLAQIDENLKERIGLSRTAWILEAIQDKLKSIKKGE